MEVYNFLSVLFLFVCTGSSEEIRQLSGVRFLLTVNDTWADPPGCIATVATDTIQPGKKSDRIQVGACDHGPIEYRITSPGKNNCKYTVSLVFHSSVIEDADPPTCDLSWNGTYLVPKNGGKPDQDLLPSCFTRLTGRQLQHILLVPYPRVVFRIKMFKGYPGDDH